MPEAPVRLPDEGGQMHTDPVCGMKVDPAKAAGTSHYKGHDYFFCAPGCKAKFDAAPERYLQPAVAPQPAPPAGGKTEWTCPMHPEIVRDAPGSCPICGMALEPRTVTLEEGPNPELADMTRRFWISAALSAPLLVGAMAGVLPPWLELALATPVVLWGAWPFFERAWSSVVNRSLNMFTLIGLGVAVAYGYSVVATIAPQLFPPGFRDGMGEVGVYFEVASVIVTLVLLGQVLELKARGQTSAAIRTLLGMAAKTARRLRTDGSDEDVPLEHVHVGDRLRVRPGEKI